MTQQQHMPDGNEMSRVIEASHDRAAAEYKRNFPGGKQMRADVFRELMRLIDYVEHDERKHFENMQENGEDVSNHIYRSIECVEDWMGCWAD